MDFIWLNMYILESSSIIWYLFWIYENTIDIRYPKAKEIKRIFRDILLYIAFIILFETPSNFKRYIDFDLSWNISQLANTW